MSGILPTRPLNSGFLRLLGEHKHRTLSDFSKDLIEHAYDARTSAEACRAARRSALDERAAGNDETAALFERQASADHRRAARSVQNLAEVARDLVQWCALDWMPTLDVQGSGLTMDELDVLCSVYGVPVERILEDGNEAVS